MVKKGQKLKKYSGKYKKGDILDMREHHLGVLEAERKYGIAHSVILKWERIYLEEGAEGLMKERQTTKIR